MEVQSTRRYFNSQFIIENKLSFSTVVLLQDIYFWVLGKNPPKSEVIEGITYYFISQTHFYKLNYGLLTQQGVSNIFKKLKNIGIIDSTILVDYHKNYISFNWNKIKESVLDEQELKIMENDNWWQRIHEYADKQIEQEKNYVPTDRSDYEIVVKNNRRYLVKKKLTESYNKIEDNMSGLFDEKDIPKKVYYSKQSDAIVRRIMKKYNQYFSMRVPKEHQEPTKTYIRTCRKIDDIYNGHFTSSRYYSFDEGVFNNKQFETEGWRERIDSVRNDWGKVKELIFESLENFILMYDEDRMPMNKSYLTTSLNDWFFSDNPNCRGQSQFVQSFNKPMFTKQKLGLDKAKGIVEDMKKKSSVSYYAGHELNSLLPENANEGTAWKFIQEIIKWGKLLWQFEKNSKYFLECEINGKLESGPKVLPALFARYLKSNKINVSLNTLNIEQGSENNGPWSWFIKDACDRHEMNFNFVKCFDADDFYDAQNNKRISFDDMAEIPLF